MDLIINVIYYIVPFVVLLGVLVFVHEFGHFIVARMLGVSVSAFSIGFGKEVWSKVDKHGTCWKLSAIPLGGYCQFLGDGDASSSTEKNLQELSEEEKKHAFASQNVWKKLAIVVAGPAFNYLFAIAVFTAIFFSVGKIVFPSVVGDVLQGEAADKAGIKSGDKIISINGKKTPDFSAVINEVNLATSDEVKVIVHRPITISLKVKEMEVPTADGSVMKNKILGLISLPTEKNENGVVNGSPAVVGNIVSESPAEEAGFKRGDMLDSVNGVKIEQFIDLKEYVSAHENETYEIKLYRPMVFNVVLQDTEFDNGSGRKESRRMLGIQSSPEITFADKNISFIQALQIGLSETWNLTEGTLRAVGQMISGQRGGKDVGGIIRIAEMSGDISKTGGLISFVYFMALLSVNLGLINLLPIPVLDGGHVVIYLIEMVTRRELKPEIKEYIFKFGLVIIMGIMLLATWNDVVHLIGRWFD